MDDQQRKNSKELKIVTKSQDEKSQQPPPVHSPGFCDEHVPHMLASASSPSLLSGCGDTSTPAGSRIERHCHSHHIHTPSSSCVTSPTGQDVGTVPFFGISPSTPSPLPSPAPCPQEPQQSVFLTPGPPRRRNLHSERPNSAPPHHLERISGVLLRLVGDHYLCHTCGRELRSIGDQFAFETDLRRALSANNLNNSLENIGHNRD